MKPTQVISKGIMKHNIPGMFYFRDGRIELNIKKEDKMISKDKQYMLMKDSHLPPEQRKIVEILATDMSGDLPVLIRSREPYSNKWILGERDEEGRSRAGTASEYLDLVEIKPERWGVVFVENSGRSYVLQNFERKTKQEFKKAIESLPHIYPIERCVFFKYPNI